MANQGKRMVKENLIAQIGQGGGADYTAGTGIDITEDVISVDSDVAMKTDLPNEVTGTNDGTNWISLTVGNDTYGIPQGGSNVIEIETQLDIRSVSGTLTADQLASLGPDTVIKVITSTETYMFYFDYESTIWNEIYYTNAKTKMYANPNDMGNIGNDGITINKSTGEYAFQGNGSITVKVPDEVSGTNDGTNWTSLTVGNDTYGLASGGSTYTAGTGIDITNDTISVDNTIATKQEVANVAARTATLYSYMERPIDVYDELAAEDPETTQQDAINEWLKRMPTFVSFNINAAGIETLQGMGFKNLVQIQLGAQYDIQGYFNIIFEGTTNTTPYAMQTCMADRVGGATTNLWNKAVGQRVQHTVVIGSTQIEFQNCRYREANTTLAGYNDLFNNTISYVQQLGVNAQTEAMLGMSNAMIPSQGREAETIAISVQGGIPANNQFNVQLKAPSADGTYTLKATVANGVPTFEWLLDQA